MEWLTLPRLGLLFDIAGAFILVVSYVAAGRAAFLDATTFYREKAEIRKIISAKCDSAVGLALIVAGFLGQLIGSDTRLSAKFEECGWCRSTTLAILIGMSVGYLAIRPWLFQRYFSWLTNENEQSSP
jgi:hypothetical protein